MGKKKNRSNNAEDKDQVIAKLTKQNEELQKKLDRLLDRIENCLLYTSPSPRD